MKIRRTVLLLPALLPAATPAQAAAGTGAAATTVLVVFGAVVLAALALTVATVLWLRSRRWRHRIADERATLDGVMGAAEDLLATADDGYLIWPAGGERAAASEKLGRMFRLDPLVIADIDVLESAIEPGDFTVFRRAIGALRSDGVAFDLNLTRAAPAATSINCRGLLAVSGAAVVWMRDLADSETLIADFEKRLNAAAGDADRLRALLDGAPYPVWRRGVDLGVVWANTTYCQAVEAPLAEVVERALELVPGIAPAEARKLALGARDSGETKIERRRFVVAGERRTYELTETPMSDGGVAGYGRDVTDRDNAAGDLTRHLDSQNEVLNQVRSAIAIFGPDRQLVFHNAAYARLWRLDEDWLASRPDHGAILERLRESRRLPETADFPAYKAGVLDLYTSVLNRRENQLHLPDGSTLRVVITPHPKGGLLFIYEDLSDQLELERSRNTLAAVQRATLDNLFEGVAVFGPDGRLKLFNRGYARLWKLEDADLVGEPHVADLIEAARPLFLESGDEAIWNRLKEAVIRGTLDREVGERTIERPDGAVLRHAAVPLPDGAMLHTYLDISDTTRVERALRERAEALEAADKLKTAFVGNMSHELRTPLNTVIGFAEVLSNDYAGDLNDKQRRYVEDILYSAQNLLDLINDILDLAVIDAGQMSLEIAPLDAAELLEGTARMIEPKALQAGIKVVTECPLGAGGFEADERRIKQVLFDLLSNALKFSARGSTVTLGARRESDHMTLWVADSGAGIAAENRAQVFEPFAHDGLDGQVGGAGLGLALVKRFIEMHGGHVELSSTPGQGTKVICRLPLKAG